MPIRMECVCLYTICNGLEFYSCTKWLGIHERRQSQLVSNLVTHLPL